MAAPLSQRLREHTRTAHRRAERSGVIRQMLAGTVSRTAYCLYLRNLQPVYATLEQRLSGCPDDNLTATIADPRVYRASPLADDLRELVGSTWTEDLPLLPAAARYRERIAGAADEHLLAHAYVRYLGDLSGGRTLRRVLRDALNLSVHEMNFYAFPDIPDPGDYKDRFRAAIDRSAATLDPEPILDEARVAFAHNVALAEAVAAWPVSED